MSAEAGFLLGYANLLLLVALGLHRLGRVNPSPWAGRVLAGHRRRSRPEAGGPDDDWTLTWPHGEQPRLHTGMALVAATAALVLAGAGLWRHHHGLEVALLAGTTTAAVTVMTHLARSL